MPLGQVANAYARVKEMGFDGPGNAAFVEKTGPSFEEFMKAGVTEAMETVAKGETVSAAAMRGKASVQEVVQSVMAADMTVQSVVAVRDRLVSAYQEILRMPV